MVARVRLGELGDVTALSDRVAEPEAGSAGRTTFTTEELFGRETEISIAHHGLTYRLRITRQGKLVLNK